MHRRSRKHTTVSLDVEQLERASSILQTSSATQTIEAALQEVIARERRHRLAARRFPDLTPEMVDELRGHRVPVLDLGILERPCEGMPPNHSLR